MRRLDLGEKESTAVADTLCKWATEGHEQTFRRLGIEFTRFLFEKDFVSRARAIARAGTESGIFTEHEGAIYAKHNDTQMPLVRSNGYETSYMRLFAIWHRLQEETSRGVKCINVAGDEWTITGRIREVCLARMLSCPLYDTYCRFVVGMVRRNGKTMKSRDGSAILVAECLDWLAREMKTIRSDLTCDLCEAFAVTALKGALLAPRPDRAMNFDAERLLDPTRSVGLVVMLALTEAAMQSAAGCGGATDGKEYRYVVLRAYELARVRQRALDDLAPRLVVQFLGSLARWYLARAGAPPSVSRLVYVTLRVGARSVNLLAPQFDRALDEFVGCSR
jgi:arginyl-tRNA synthetase